MKILNEKDRLGKFIALVSDKGIEILIDILDAEKKRVVADILNGCDTTNKLLNAQGKLMCVNELITYLNTREKRFKLLDNLSKP